MKINVDIDGMEQQRYDAIKKSGKYLELDILIGADKEKDEHGNTVKMPVVTSVMHRIGSEEIANLYTILTQLKTYYEKEYPIECLLAGLTTNCSRMNCINTVKTVFEKEDESKEEK